MQQRRMGVEEEACGRQRGGLRLLPFETRQRCNGTLSDTAAAARAQQAHTYKERALKPVGARQFPPHLHTHTPSPRPSQVHDAGYIVWCM